MTVLNKTFSVLVARYGGNSAQWPAVFRWLLPVFLTVDSCSSLWAETQAEERKLSALYRDEFPTLEPSDAFRARLSTIAVPRRQVVKEAFMPVWRLSFATAMASALLGVVLGAGGYFADYSESDIYSFDATASYEVSNWIAGTDL
ncbi:Uncharacterised protein [Zhongshania aliphaticivorans]|uniref:Uncharacterized protein n=1 Tax=Zhongshania aliphaticivorans TaxID=1470434 RepID=A0A5S9NUF3_9GAMM|nr:hypothetical protein [Zhongshania aliphaticivorans]CAA0094260.1 Uncharacterised protein [Zhongshania aliphaticivorans]CAA0112346.1 Uncharacterised protein [Zhongshania aliphaticivorans]